MDLKRRHLLAGTAAIALPKRRAHAQGGGQASPIRIGVLTDMSGVYRDATGPTSVACTRQAVSEFVAAHPGIEVEVIAADHQNRADIGAGIARRWFDRDGVDVVVDVGNSAVALAVNGVCREKNRAYVNSSAGALELTGSQCSPMLVHWTFDNYMLSRSTGAAMVKVGGRSWFFITADYAFGQSLERETASFVREAGGTVLGSVRHPFPGTGDFSSFLLQAQSSGAEVVALCNAGNDTIACIKQAAEFGLTRGKTRLAGMLMFISDIHALGLEAAKGLVLTESFYWDLNDRTRAFTARVLPRTDGARPDMSQAGCYGGTMHYLKAVADMGVAEAKKGGIDVVARMKAMPTDDDAFGPGTIREDGRALHPAYLFEVKAPGESRGPWDYYKLLATTPADQAFRPMQEGGCPLVHA